MQLFVSNPRHEAEGESGFVLLAVIFLTLLLLITLAIAAPKMAMSIQRDKDVEAIHRGEQYKRAIQLYYRQFGRYPTSVDQLVQTNQIRFLRKRYTDPETGKDDWKPVVYGQAHVRPLGFFGQPLSAGGGAVAAMAMGNTSMGMYAPDAGTNVTKDANGVPVSGDSSGPGMSSSTPSGGGAGTMAPSNGTFSMGGQSGSGLGSGSGSSFGSGPSFGGSSFGGSQPGSSFGSSPMGGTNPGMGSGMGTPGTGGPAGMGTSATSFGGSQGPIVGVTLPMNKASVVIYKKQDHYNKWEFNYDPVEDQMKAAASLFGGSSPMGGAPGGMMPGGTNPMGGGASPLGGSAPGNSGQSDPFGFGSGTGGSPSPSPTPTPQPPANNPQ